MDGLFDTKRTNEVWAMEDYAEKAVAEIRRMVGDQGRALLALSGGVDSSVCAALMHRAIGDRLTCLFVDHGLLRLYEPEQVEQTFRQEFHMNLICVNARQRFLGKLAGVTDPEQKRRIIGEEFIRVFEEESKKIGAVDFLVQGTIYPDVTESGGDGARQVKSHHNVGGLPDVIDFREIIEPVRPLYKEEVRALGRVLGLPEVLVSRQPFPGPGLGVRVIGEITAQRLDTLRAADFIFREEMEKAGLQKQASQYFAVLTNLYSVGVTEGARTYNAMVALRAVSTQNFVEGDWVRLPHDLLETVSRRIVTDVPGVNRVVYDITSKPPATIEWE